MKQTFLFIALALCVSLVSLPALADNSTAPAGLTKEEAKARKKAARKLADRQKARAKLRFKWHKSLKSALAAAKKYNTTCLVVFSNPAGCAYCIKLEEEVFSNSKFKNAKGIGVGYASTQPIAEYGLIDGMPSVVIVGPDGKAIGGQLGYIPDSDNLAYYLRQLEEAQPAWDKPEAEAAPEAPEIP